MYLSHYVIAKHNIQDYYIWVIFRSSLHNKILQFRSSIMAILIHKMDKQSKHILLIRTVIYDDINHYLHIMLVVFSAGVVRHDELVTPSEVR